MNELDSRNHNRNSIDSEVYHDTSASGIDIGSPTPRHKSHSKLPSYSKHDNGGQSGQGSSRTNTPYQSALASASGSTISLSHSHTEGDGGLGLGADDSFQSQDRTPGGEDLTPYVVQKPQIPNSASTVILRHSDEVSISDDDEEDLRDLSYGLDPTSPTRTNFVNSPNRQRNGGGGGGTVQAAAAAAGGTADKAGVILGIFNVFIVMPQFVITALSSLIFHIMEPPTSDLPPKHPNAIPIGNPNATTTLSDDGTQVMRMLMSREGGVVEAGSPDAVGLIFRYVPHSTRS